MVKHFPQILANEEKATTAPCIQCLLQSSYMMQKVPVPSPHFSLLQEEAGITTVPLDLIEKEKKKRALNRVAAYSRKDRK